MKRHQGKGKANDISGIPLPGTLTQIEGRSIEPNRDEPNNAFKLDEPDQEFGHDYFNDEEERLGNLDGPFVANKSNEQWSDGIADEANEADDADDEGLLPETQPLHVEVRPGLGEDDNYDTALNPDNVEDDSAA